MSARDEQAVKLIVAEVLARLIEASDKQTRQEVAKSWTVGDRLNGIVSDAPAGAVQVKKGAVKATVTDRPAFEAWVQAERPEEWETFVPRPVARVRPAYESSVLSVAKTRRVAVTPLGEPIPGITVSEGDPVVALTLAKGAADLVAAAWQSGELWEIVGSLLPALEAAPEAAS